MVLERANAPLERIQHIAQRIVLEAAQIVYDGEFLFSGRHSYRRSSHA
jgi:hypothetical protein